MATAICYLRAMCPSRGRDAPEPLSREVLIARALEITKTEGIGAVGMRRLSKEFGVWPAAVHYHISSKDALLDAICEAVTQSISIPPPDSGLSWRRWLRELAVRAYEVFGNYPGVMERYMVRGPMTPQPLAIMESATAVLLEAGLDETQASRAYWAVFHFMASSVLLEHAAVRKSGYENALAEFSRILAEDPSPRPVLQQAIRQVVLMDRREAFEFTLDSLLDGLEGRFGETAARPRPASE